MQPASPLPSNQTKINTIMKTKQQMKIKMTNENKSTEKIIDNNNNNNNKSNDKLIMIVEKEEKVAILKI